MIAGLRRRSRPASFASGRPITRGSTSRKTASSGWRERCPIPRRGAGTSADAASAPYFGRYCRRVE
jgi:hypothetical protein